MSAAAVRVAPPKASMLSEVFDPRANSIGFLRWLMAFLVIFSHAGPLAGFYGGADLGVQISSEQSIGGVAVAGFFFFSGFLITQSRMGRSSIFRYFWRRALRIFPAFWAALLLTAFVLAPIAWWRETGSWGGFWSAGTDSPWTYFSSNMWLELGQRNIAEMGQSLPLASHGGFDWNGSAWTLRYEFRAYILVGILGLVGVLAYRWLTTVVAVGIIVLNALQWSGAGQVSTFFPRLFDDPFMLMFLSPFALGMLFAIWQDRIPIDDRLAIAGLAIAGATYAFGGWNIWGVYGFCYVLMWFAIRATRLQHWEKHGDLSYGVYIFAWPLMQFGAYFDLQGAGWLVYHVVIVAGVHVLAFLSWHGIEKPAMSLKGWTPRWLAYVWDRGVLPTWDAVMDRVVDPRFSSTRRAAAMRERKAAS
ncbi:acyltransferase family protein [Agrococcus jejuensis]|uniref:Peptidoglycan/LPS O-acetylase OafA/YrhL, contains acyltransferase and SGNH-hydrolase domains n=1 Tax=Agrococcus jejuensis TaxID=399736 RepID=A0A1G8FHN6_9MICO|nr:acyltransferase [Agrococcus jejuensis]SDH81671.1 Peptidoglycan/LPS O-acetylase OafA/YrhL, contains acyltransferase and SGNH-hydrolase domains [Agrococcus jejuensis]